MKLLGSLVNLVALTHLRTRQRQTLISALGVMFGIAMFVFMLNFVQALNRLLRELMMSQTAHVHLFNETTVDREMLAEKLYPGALTKVHSPRPRNEPARLKDGFQVLEIIRQAPEVVAASPLVSTQAFYTYGPVQITGNILGVDIRAEDRMFDLRSDVIAGNLRDLLTLPNGVVIGAGLAQKMGIGVGDYLDAVSPVGVQQRLKVVAVTKTGVTQIDDTRSYTTIRTAQRLMQQNSRYLTDINVRLTNEQDAPAVAKRWRRQFGYQAESWQVANASIRSGDQLRNYIFYSVVVAIMVVAGFGIYNVLSMMIREKMMDIAILKAIGLTGTDVQNIFLREAMAIGIFGGIAGLGVGALISWLVSKVPFESDMVMEITSLPMDYDWQVYLAGFLFGLILTGVAGYLPARKAAKVDPISIIRGR